MTADDIKIADTIMKEVERGDHDKPIAVSLGYVAKAPPVLVGGKAPKKPGSFSFDPILKRGGNKAHHLVKMWPDLKAHFNDANVYNMCGGREDPLDQHYVASPEYHPEPEAADEEEGDDVGDDAQEDHAQGGLASGVPQTGFDTGVQYSIVLTTCMICHCSLTAM